MHDKVSVVDGFSFWLFPGIFFKGAKSIVIQTSVVFRPKSQEEGSSEGEWGGGGLWKKARLQTILCDYQIL